ncbi:ABC transporter substrate-binding protein [Rhodocytophaga rosea]|uniref:ABC transporter substrate-binding protein n=1 Tax=Rhodocytophaga rosea TaxID=2704465 RepID=A0A6C0GK84_9BACT|nr:substrate-binding domain-containing protein [Rhodocytophaga rosea]QHT68438.1 ABC transporter substrate-binding protein [Rhodocytophaga rosea]
MKPTETLKIGGVPEHFNLPWHQAISQGDFEGQGIQIEWKEYPGGTGEMTRDLRNGSLDLAVLLTEGIVADIVKGNPSKIISLYVESPLIWGIHVPAHSGLQNIEDIQGKRYAISRMGSGSHLMAFVDTSQRGWPLTEEQLVIVGNLQGAREAFRNNEAEVFMWERFMTQPFVDNGEFRRVGECPTPWPCFVIAARNEVIATRKEALQKVLQTIYQANGEFMQNKSAPGMVSERFGIKPDDATAWFAHTKWASNSQLSPKILTEVVDTLYRLHLIDRQAKPEEVYIQV